MTETHLTLRIKDGGDLAMEGVDFGQAPMDFFGTDEYEYFVTVPSDKKDALLLQLVRDQFMSGPTPTSSFMQYLKEHDIPYDFETW